MVWNFLWHTSLRCMSLYMIGERRISRVTIPPQGATTRDKNKRQQQQSPKNWPWSNHEIHWSTDTCTWSILLNILEHLACHTFQKPSCSRLWFSCYCQSKLYKSFSTMSICRECDSFDLNFVWHTCIPTMLHTKFEELQVLHHRNDAYQKRYKQRRERWEQWKIEWVRKFVRTLYTGSWPFD